MNYIFLWYPKSQNKKEALISLNDCSLDKNLSRNTIKKPVRH